MSYKKLTNTGIQFIRTICKGTGNSLLSGSNKHKLSFTNDPANTVYTANPTLHGEPLVTNFQLGEALIQWFNKYSKLYEIDANIVAAQAFIESKYVLWAFPSGKGLDTPNKSSAQGISQFLSRTLYDVTIGNHGVANRTSTIFTQDEIDKLTNGLIDPNLQSSYKYDNTSSTYPTALSNRKPLFQNCMDNPDLMIKAQCRLVKGISFKSSNNAASTLFGYNQGPAYVDKTFTATLKNAEPNTLSKTRYNEGVNYVEKIFRVLGDINSSAHKPKGIWFGYDIDFTFDEFLADVASSNSDIREIDRSLRLSPNYVLQDLVTTDEDRTQLNVPTKAEYEKLKKFATVILEPINELLFDNGYNKILIVNSSFRSDDINQAVGGVNNSQHRLAEAADVRVETSDQEELFNIFKLIIANGTIPYDQLIYETKGTDIKLNWIHISHVVDNPEENDGEKMLATKVGDGMNYEFYTNQNRPIA